MAIQRKGFFLVLGFASRSIYAGLATTYTLQYSTSSDRSAPKALAGSRQPPKPVYVFLTPATVDIQSVSFFIGTRSDGNTPTTIEKLAPFDLATTVKDNPAVANPYDGTAWTAGENTVSTTVLFKDNTSKTVTAVFNAYKLEYSTFPNRVAPAFLTSTPVMEVGGNVYIGAFYNAPSVASWKLYLDGALTNTVMGAMGPFDLLPSGIMAKPLDTTGIPGIHSVRSVISFAPGANGIPVPDLDFTQTFNVKGCATRFGTQILPCVDYVREPNITLTFSGDAGGLPDKNGVGTGFTYVATRKDTDKGYRKLNLKVANGMLSIATTSGAEIFAANNQDNVVGIALPPIDSITTVEVTLVKPPKGTMTLENGGLHFGISQQNYVKLVVRFKDSATVIELLLETEDKVIQAIATGPLGDLSASTVRLQMLIDPSAPTDTAPTAGVTGSYSINGAAFKTVGNLVIPNTFTSADAATIPLEERTQSFACLTATHRTAAAPPPPATRLPYVFDNFAVTVGNSGVPPDNTIEFNRYSTVVAYSPTAVLWAPNKKLYTAGTDGVIHQYGVEAVTYALIEEGPGFTPLKGRLVLGLALDPASTAANVVLWASSSLGADGFGVANSGAIHRLSYNAAHQLVAQLMVTGLPRSLHDHAPNGLVFGPDKRLYITIGGNTASGCPSYGIDLSYGLRPEQAFSSAVTVFPASIASGTWSLTNDGMCATTIDESAGTSGPVPATCKGKTWVTGVRNMYRIVFTSTGAAYGVDNGVGTASNFPLPLSQAAPNDCVCAKQYDTFRDPGVQADRLYRLKEGRQYGQPHPFHKQCVWRDGVLQRNVPGYSWVVQPASYDPPAWVIKTDDARIRNSADGLIEYRSACAFGGDLKGSLLTTLFSVGDNIQRFKLTADGSVASSDNIIGGFRDPLDLAEGDDGLLFVAEFDQSSLSRRVTVLVPKRTSC